VTIPLVALLATLIALPKFVEIPLARVSSRRVALLALPGVWLTAALGGFLLEYSTIQR